jgi:hypothetical protein
MERHSAVVAVLHGRLNVATGVRPGVHISTRSNRRPFRAGHIPEVPHIYVAAKVMLDVRAECRRTGRGAVAITKRVALVQCIQSAPPGTYAAIAVVILASVCHVRPRCCHGERA